MRHSLVIPRLVLSRCLGRLLGGRQTTAGFPIAQVRAGTDTVLLVSGPQANGLSPPAPSADLHPLELSIGEIPPAEWTRPSWPRHVRCRLWLGRRPGQPVLWAAVQTNGAIEPLHELLLPGPGMERIRLTPPESGTPSDALSESDRQRHSRTIGALGGEPVWLRLRGLAVVIIGCGRTGSLLAADLARLGIRRLTLTDPDRIEPHNLGEMDLVTEADCGRTKAGSLAARLHGLADPGARIRSLPVSVQHPAAREACRDADVLCCCADNDAARLTAALLATLHHKVLLDIGTGIHFGEIRNPNSELQDRTMGADVRLILPGDGCLLCRGNLTQYARAVEDLVAHRAPAVLEADWRRQRAGSLRSLNQMAVGLAVQMLQDLVARRLRASLGAHLECDPAGHATIRHPPLPKSGPSCPLCAKAGQGDAALQAAKEPVTSKPTHELP